MTFGMTWGSAWGDITLPAMSVSDISALPHAECCYMLFLQGIPDVYVTDHADMALLGSGDGSWIARTESALAHETVGRRTVRRGLKMPSNLRVGEVDAMDGLQDTDASFSIVDFDGRLAELFSIASWDSMDTLRQRYGPNDTDATVVGLPGTPNGNTTISISDRYVGLERMGPAAGGVVARQQFPAFPFAMTGSDHIYIPDESGGTKAKGNAPPPIPVSDTPVIHEGRICALYRIYRDPITGEWPRWNDQYDSGYSLVWWGTLKDRGEIGGLSNGYRVWNIGARGPDSLLHKPLNPFGSRQFVPVETETGVLSEEERRIGVLWYLKNHSNNANSDFDIQGYWFGSGTTLSSGLTQEGLAQEINGIIADVADGTTTNIFSGHATAISTSENLAGEEVTYRFERGPDGYRFTCRAYTSDRDTGGAFIPKTLHCHIVLHEKVWLALGWQPDIFAQKQLTQASGGGELVAKGDEVDAVPAPYDGYWRLKFSNMKNDPEPELSVGDGEIVTAEVADNGGGTVVWPGEGAPNGSIAGGTGVHIISREGSQKLLIGESLTIEPNMPIGWASTSEVSSPDSGGHLLLRGNIIELPDGGYIANGVAYDKFGKEIELEEEERYYIARASWNQDYYGKPTVDATISTDFAISKDEFIDQRLFGIENDSPPSTIAFAPGSAIDVQARPLMLYTVGKGLSNFSWQVLGAMLHSTGSATGWSGAIDSGLVSYTFGSNNPTSGLSAQERTAFAGDVYPSTMGLAIPYQLVASATDIRDAMVIPQFGYEDSTAYEYIHVSPGMESKELIQSLLLPRGCAMSLAGGTYNVTRIDYFEPDEVDATITQDSLYGAPGDPSSVIPDQDVRLYPPIDKIEAQYRYHPGEEKFLKTWLEKSVDPGARNRRGDIPMRLDFYGRGRDNKGGWQEKFKHYWRTNRAKFFAGRHFPVRMRLNRVAARDVWPGSKVRLSNPWPLAPGDTTYSGLTNRLGIVTSTEWTDDMAALDVEIVIFDKEQSDFAFFAPIGHVASYSGTTITLTDPASSTDYEQYSSAEAFVEPSWSDSGGRATIDILAYDRRGWTSVTTREVVSRSGQVLTVDTSVDADLADYANCDLYVLMASETEQQAGTGNGQWVRDLYVEHALEDGTFNTSEGAKRLLP